MKPEDAYEVVGWGSLLDQLKDLDGLKSDAALARTLGVTRGFISAVRKGRKNISAELGELIFTRLRKPIREEDLELFKPLRAQRSRIHRMPSSIEKAWVFKRSCGNCELCECPAPFKKPDGSPYLEIHYLLPISEGGNPEVKNMVALCPNCRRKVEVLRLKEDEQKLVEKAQLTIG